MAAASPFNGSIGLGYVNNWGRKDSNIFDKSATVNEREWSLVEFLRMLDVVIYTCRGGKGG